MAEPDPKSDVMDFAQGMAWPLAIVVLAVIFRKQIGEKIASMTKLSTPIGETQWNARAEELNERAEEVVVEAAPAPEAEQEPPPRDADETTHANTPDDQISSESLVATWKPNTPGSYFDTYNALAQIEPSAAVIYMWGIVEERIKLLAEHIGFVPDSTYRFTKMVRMLSEKGFISRDVARLVDDLRRLRNEAAHMRGVNIDSQTYMRTAQLVIRAIDFALTLPGQHTRPLGT